MGFAKCSPTLGSLVAAWFLTPAAPTVGDAKARSTSCSFDASLELTLFSTTAILLLLLLLLFC